MTNIGFIGLGIMGGPMASHLNDKGYNLSVFNRSKEKSEKWITQNTKAKVCLSTKDIATECDIIILCVGNDNDVRQIVDETKNLIRPGTVIIDHTTTSAKIWPQPKPRTCTSSSNSIGPSSQWKKKMKKCLRWV